MRKRARFFIIHILFLSYYYKENANLCYPFFVLL
jgi:hypothetical protein